MRSILLGVVLFAAGARADVPRLLSHEGRLLRADGNPERGNAQLTFALYPVPTGGASIWSESQSIALSASGYYATQLGRTAPLPASIDGPLWLGIAVQGEPEMAPRAQVTAAAYSLRSATADDATRLGGAVASAYQRSDRLRAVYIQWGVSGCTAGSTTLTLGYAMTTHYTHSDNGEPLCLKRSADPGTFTTYAGDILYSASLNGGAVHFGVIQDNRRLACSRCATTRASCFRMDGDHACPAGFSAMYTGYLYGGHYTHTGRMSPICADHLNFDNSLANTPDTGGYLYPTYTNNAGNTGITTGSHVKCAMCCAD